MAGNTTKTFEAKASFSGDSQLRLQTIVRLRWVGVLGQILALGVVYFWLGFDLPAGPCLIVIAVSAWVKQATDSPSHRIDACDVVALELVAGKTRKSQVYGSGIAKVFFGDDVISGKWTGKEALGKEAVLAAKAGAFADKVIERRVHRSFFRW